MVYDARSIDQDPGPLFDPEYWKSRAAVVGETMGRGVTYFVRHQQEEWVLRHYRRGGVVASLSHDCYLWTGLAGTRAWREWKLLLEMRERQLPVPRPVAARVIRRGLCYTADIIVERIPGARPLAEVLNRQALSESAWQSVGGCVRRLHEAGFSHADLNARNILLDESGGVFLVDFDKSAKRRYGNWREGNLARLERSLRKFHASSVSFQFGEQCWRSLMTGYRDAGESSHSKSASA